MVSSNYAELARDDIFWRAVRNTVLWACTPPLIEVSIALLLALALYAKVPGARFFRVAWFTPVLMSYVVVGILWLWIYNNDWGPVNVAMRALGLGSWTRPWLGDPKTALALPHLRNELDVGRIQHGGAAGSAAFSPQRGYRGGRARQLRLGRQACLLYLAARARHAPEPHSALFYRQGAEDLDLVWITTKGNPLWATETVSTYVYKRAFEWTTFDLGYPSTVAAVWFVIVLATVLTLTWAFRQREKLEY